MSLIGTLPEILAQVLGHLEIRQRERLRLVSPTWNSIALDLRHPVHIRSIRFSPAALPFALHVRAGEYISLVTTQEEFDLLWPHVQPGHLPAPQFVTSDTLDRAVHCVYSYRLTSSRIISWTLQLEYSLMTQVLSNRLLDQYVGSMQIHMADELIRQSQSRTLDPRKIFWIPLHFHNVMRHYIPERCGPSPTWQISVARQFSIIPESAIYQVLVQGRHLDSTLVKTVRGMGCRLSREELPPEGYTVETFAEACRRVMATK